MTQTTPTSTAGAPAATGGERSRSRTPRGGSSAPARPRLPAGSGGRRPARIAIAVLLIVGGAVAAALLALRLDERVPVLVFARSIPAGQQITAADLAQTQVASDRIPVVPAGQADEVVGRYAATSILEGQLVIPGITVAEEPVPAGTQKVGANLGAGRFPVEGLQAGDVVRLVAVADGAAGETLVERARVAEVPRDDDDGGFFGGGGGGGREGFGVTFAVPAEQAPAVAAAAANDDLVAILVSRGEPASAE